jgi:acetyl-CoA carboxylase biotin carboxyl carrier protein
MNFDEIKQLLDMVREHELSEFELERDNFKIRIRKNAVGQWTATLPPVSHVNYAPVMAPPIVAGPPPAAPEAPPVLTPAQEDVDFVVVKSPIVGTFYRAPEPGAKPFADVGDTVRKGQVLCIIEAMKLMNEINSDVDGEVVKVYVENGQPVQYGERLFAIKPV